MEHIKQVVDHAVLAQSERATRERAPSTAESNSTDTFGLDAYTVELQTAVRCAHEFLHRAQTDPIWLSLLGNCGAGKTHLAMEIYRRFRPRRFLRPDPNSMGGREHIQKKQKFHWSSVIDTMRSGDFGIIGYICDDIDFAIIDDLGAGYDSELTKKKASEIAERRIGKPTIWTSNLDLEQISEQIDMRVSSRMLRYGSRVMVFEETRDWNVQTERVL